MLLKALNDEDTVNYNRTSMFLIFPNCSFKCGKELCQNYSLRKEQNLEVEIDEIVDRYIMNPLTHAIVCGGLEPFDSWKDLQEFIKKMRVYTADDIVIYSGYKEEELSDKIEWLKDYENIIVKFGRYIPNKEPHLDKILGVKLASPNQYARRIS